MSVSDKNASDQKVNENPIRCFHIINENWDMQFSLCSQIIMLIVFIHRSRTNFDNTKMWNDKPSLFNDYLNWF